MKFSEWVLEKVAKEADIDISKYDKKELKMGMEEEEEHGPNGKTDVTKGDPVKTLKITVAHLDEDPKYYTKLKKTFN